MKFGKQYTYIVLVALLITLLIFSSFGVTMAGGAKEEKREDDWDKRIKVEDTPENDPQYQCSKAIREGKHKEKGKGKEGEGGTPPECNSPPSSSQLKKAIDEGYNYVDKLYQLGVGSSVWDAVKEYPSSPVGIYDRTKGKWVLAGQEGYVDVITVIGIGDDYDVLDYKFVELDTGEIKSPYLWVDRYYYTNGDTKLIISFQAYYGTHKVDIYFYKTLLWSNIGSGSPSATKTIWIYSFGVFPAYRYTTRHGSQISANMYNVWGTKWSGYYLDKMLSDFGFTYDIYDPCWMLSNGYPNDFFFKTQTYHDVDVYGGLPRGSWYYPYKSRVGINRDAYIAGSSVDPLIKTLWVIHMLNKYGQPDTLYSYYGAIVHSPRSMMRHVEFSYWWDGEGIGIIPGYPPDFYYGIRLATFLIAETILGYQYGDATSKDIADQACEILYQIQIGADGYLETTDYGVVLRPQHRGGILAGYVIGTSYPFKQPKLSLLIEAVLDIIKIFTGWADMQAESKGIIPTNLETTCVGVQAFRVYLYHKYGVAYPNKKGIPIFDNFDDNTINTNKWDKLQTAGATVTETNERLQVSVPSGTGWAQAGLVTKYKYPMNGFTVKIDVVEDDDLSQMDLMICLTKTTTSDPYNEPDWYRISKVGRWSALYIQRRKAGTLTNIVDIPWAGATGNLEITVSGGMIEFYENGVFKYSESYQLPSYDCWIYVYTSTLKDEDWGTDAFDNSEYLWVGGMV